MTTYYGEAFRFASDNSPYPSKAYTYESLEDAKNCYLEFVADAEKFGFGEPKDWWLYKGTPDGDEEKYGYPEFPDYVLSTPVGGGELVVNKILP